MAAFGYTYACWQSPSGNGVKALIKIADGTKHRLHFAALRETFPDADPSGVNEERLCFESFDPHLYHNPNAETYAHILEVKQVKEKTATAEDDTEKFKNLLKWIANKGEAFVSGSRNSFIFKLAGACCRFGLDMNNAASLIASEYPSTNDFTAKELMQAVKSAYRINASSAGSVQFEKEILVDIKSRKEIKLKELPGIDPDAKPRDVIYSADVKAQAMLLHSIGFQSVKGINLPEIDNLWKPKRGELTGLTGIGNYGKSAFYKWYLLMRSLIYGEKFATFSPEDNPPEEYYNDFVEMFLGRDCTPKNFLNHPTTSEYEQAYDWVGQHIFYLYPQEFSPTPEYVKERFLELIIKEKVDGVGIDPFNQLTHDYGGGRSDIYLSSVLGDFSRFAQANNVYFTIIAHPKQLAKQADKNYPCPDIFDLNDGAMWNNKMDNILAYHRPFRQTDPNNPTAEFHSKKIKRQKIVGRPDVSTFEYNRTSRRFEFNGRDPMADALRAKFERPSAGIVPSYPSLNGYQPEREQPDENFWKQ